MIDCNLKIIIAIKGYDQANIPITYIPFIVILQNNVPTVYATQLLNYN